MDHHIWTNYKHGFSWEGGDIEMELMQHVYGIGLV